MAVLFAVVASAACDRLLDVEPPDRVPGSLLNNPALALVDVLGAVASYECALANYVVATGLLTDELYPARGAPLGNWDRRTEYGSGGSNGCSPTPTYAFGVYVPISQARAQADQAFGRIERFADADVPAPGKTALLATAAAYAGYSYALFGEGFCEAAFDEGPALDWRPVLELAETRFTTALALAEPAGIDSLTNLALVGRARVRLSLGKLAEAAADARLVRPGFVKYATYSSANDRRRNRVYRLNQFSQVISVDPRFRNLQVGGVTDSRVRVTDAGRAGEDGRTPLWLQTKYPSESSPIAMASWDEAQLIVAEVDGGATAVDRINALRTQAALPAFASSDAAAIAQQVLVERQRELFLEGHRLNDMLRFGLPFDTLNHLGLPNGDLTCFRLPTLETDNNPNLRGRPPRTSRSP